MTGKNTWGMIEKRKQYFLQYKENHSNNKKVYTDGLKNYKTIHLLFDSQSLTDGVYRSPWQVIKSHTHCTPAAQNTVLISFKKTILTTEIGYYATLFQLTR